MSLTLQLVSKTLTRAHRSPFLTIFSPSDSAFASSGQPSLSLLEFHFSPLSLPLYSLKKLPCNSKIPTLSPSHSLVITSFPSDCNVSLKGVNLTHKPIYNDGLLVIYGINEFFNPGYGVSDSPFKTDQDAISPCGFSFNDSVNAFEEASGVLRSKGYSLMGSFLELQLLGFSDRSGIAELTVFAPFDGVMMDYVGNVSEYSSLLLRHTVPCKISWSDLVGFDDGDALKTFLNGFKINVTRSDGDDDLLMLNGVVISSPNLYYSDWLVVHGIHEVLAVPATTKEATESSSQMGGEIAPDRSEF
ncbi:putative fasciclin-like arabinogalactan protein 20 [Citrus sinensis]|uniref:putative fasciclin-like arabinogalactan protein 20 n=1 Tax=Citrus sinensis TaxID=2711 RepID=UPI000D630526|nr:putative fasciclin-like arabinogalactan protein 20 [Citrus sinensis]